MTPMDGLTLYGALLDGCGSAIQQAMPQVFGPLTLLLEAYLLATVTLLCALIFACRALLSLCAGDTYAAGWPTRSGQWLWELMERDATSRDATRLGGR